MGNNNTMLMSHRKAARCETDDEEALRLQMLAEMERQEAYEAVSKAISSYRWWGWTMLMCRLCMFITSIKLRLGMRLWP